MTRFHHVGAPFDDHTQATAVTACFAAFESSVVQPFIRARVGTHFAFGADGSSREVPSSVVRVCTVLWTCRDLQ